MKKIVADTSALISLSFSGHLSDICSTIEVNIPVAVQEELEEIASYSDNLSKAAKECLALIHQKKIKLHDKNSTVRASRHVNSKIDYGEAACFELAIEYNIPFLILDDISAANALSGSIFFKKVIIKLSVALLVELYIQKKITKNELQKSLKAMIQNRKWGKSVMERAIQKYFD